jgi:hypothetical protein
MATMNEPDEEPGTLSPDVADVLRLDRLESDSARSRSLALPLLLPGTLIVLQTRNARYRLVVTNASQRRVKISGGKLFPESVEAELIGAADDEGVKVGWIVEGFQLEFLTDRGPVLTSVVDSVAVE